MLQLFYRFCYLAFLTNTYSVSFLLVLL
uniref:Uncharacterized protein n=1 Tax=Rhizophora mucronata TaxID=61149 RepID=A0A2P2QJF1_RHIMU